MGVGDAARDAKLINGAVADLTLITGQKPEIRKARKSIAQFKLREGMPIARARDAARRPHVGVPGPSRVHRAAPYPRLPRPVGQPVRRQRQLHVGLNEQSMFHEIDVDKIDRPRGMDITVVTTATNNEEGRALLKHLGFRSGELSPWLKGTGQQGQQKPKFAVRAYTRCQKCGRPHSVFRKFGLCRICVSRDGARRRAAGRSQELLVSENQRRLPSRTRGNGEVKNHFVVGPRSGRPVPPSDRGSGPGLRCCMGTPTRKVHRSTHDHD